MDGVDGCFWEHGPSFLTTPFLGANILRRLFDDENGKMFDKLLSSCFAMYSSTFSPVLLLKILSITLKLGKFIKMIKNMSIFISFTKELFINYVMRKGRGFDIIF